MAALQRDPFRGWEKVGIEQLLDWDTKHWIYCAEHAVNGVRPDVHNVRPLDNIMRQALTTPRLALLQLPARSTSSEGGARGAPQDTLSKSQREATSNKQQRIIEQLRAENRHLKTKQNAKAAGQAGGSGGSKHKNKIKRGPLRGMPMNYNGVGVCFAFQEGKCKQTVKDNKCKYGLHVCPSCGSADCGFLRCTDRQHE